MLLAVKVGMACTCTFVYYAITFYVADKNDELISHAFYRCRELRDVWVMLISVYLN